MLWELTRFYGHTTWDEKYLSWTYLRYLHNRASYPLVVIGDFWEILNGSEKESRNVRQIAMMQAFRDCLVICELEDLRFIGDSFT